MAAVVIAPQGHGPRCFFTVLSTVAALLLLSHQCSAHGLNRGLLASSNTTQTSAIGWSTAVATWYGPANGDGTDGGACGYADAVGKAPFLSMVSAGGPSLFKSGKGCGACYQVKCTNHRACSGRPVTVAISDLCPDGPCASDAWHFDLSGTAFGAMALPGQANQLRNAGVLSVQFMRTRCNYPGWNLAFRVDSHANNNYLAVAIEFEDGDGDLGAVLVHEAGTSQWRPMQQSWGAVWKLNSGSTLRGPFSFVLTTLTSRKTITVKDVIPAAWRPGATYWSSVNFRS